MQLVNSTTKLLQKAYTELARDNSPKITVNAVTKQAGTSRGTFYLYYDSIESLKADLSETLLEKLFSYTPGQHTQAGEIAKDYLHFLSEFTIKHRDELYSFIVYETYEPFIEKYKEFLKKCTSMCHYDKKTLNEESINYVIAAAIGIIRVWLMDNDGTDTAQLDQLAWNLAIHTKF